MSPAGYEPALVKGRLSVTGLKINPNFSLAQLDAQTQQLKPEPLSLKTVWGMANQS